MAYSVLDPLPGTEPGPGSGLTTGPPGNSPEYFHCLETPPCSPPPPLPLATADLFTVSIVLPFPKCHRVGIIQYIAFSNWLLSLSNMHVGFLHVFSA